MPDAFTKYRAGKKVSHTMNMHFSHGCAGFSIFAILFGSSLNTFAAGWVDGANGITTSGRVGIGGGALSTTSYPLHIKAINYQGISLETSNGDSNVDILGKPTGTGDFSFHSFGGKSGFGFYSGDPAVNFGTMMLLLRLGGQDGKSTTLKLPSYGVTPEMAIRGNSDTWLFGYLGTPGNEDISIGTQDAASPGRTLTLASGGKARMKFQKDGTVAVGGADFTTDGFAFQAASSTAYKQFRIRASGTGTGGEPLLKFSGSYNTKNGAEIWQDAAGSLRFNSNGSKPAMILFNRPMPAYPAEKTYLGLGTYTPAAKLDVTLANNAENLVSLNQNGKKQFEFQAADNGKGGVLMGFRNEGAATTNDVAIALDSRTYKSSYIVAGNVGIGTKTPMEKLEVAGNIKAKAIMVDEMSIPPDYVFEKGYQLASLKKVETYVNKHKHLPDVPSAKELQSKGMNLAEMNLTLLKKVEELTLHAIAQEKQIEILKAGIQELRTEFVKPGHR